MLPSAIHRSSCKKRHLRVSITAVIVTCTACGGSVSAQELGAAAAGALRATEPGPIVSVSGQAHFVVFEVVVNGRQTGTWQLVKRADLLFADEESLAAWQLKPTGEPLMYRSFRWYPLAALAGFKSRVIDADQRLELEFDPTLFPATTVRANSGIKALERVDAGWGGFVNHDTVAEYGRALGQRGTVTLSSALETVAFSPFGSLSNSVLARNLTQNESANPRGVVRLESTFRSDFAQWNRTLRIGDAQTSAGAWGRSLYFGGVQWRRNFALNPEIPSTPLQTISGIASVPTTIDLFINGQLSSQFPIEPGPFSITHQPSVGSSGEASFVVRDLLGRELRVTQPFYETPALLAAGKSDDSYEIGAERKNFGLRSNDYGRAFAISNYRYGVNDRMTVEGRAEILKRQQTFGLGAVTMVPGGWPLLIYGSGAFSRAPDAGSGHSVTVGLDHASQRFNVGARLLMQSKSFVQLGENPFRHTTREAVLTAALKNLSYGTLSAALIDRRYDDKGSVQIGSLAWRYVFSNRLSVGVSLNASREVRADGVSVRDHSIALSCSIPLWHGNVNGSVTARKKDSDGYVQYAETLPSSGLGTAWRGLVGYNSSARVEAGVTHTNRWLRSVVEASAERHAQALRVNLANGIGVIDSTVFVSRPIAESFAVVKTAMPGVDVRLNHQLAGTTNQSGDLIVPQLHANQNNTISLDGQSLPLDVDIPVIEREVAPPFRSGVVINMAPSAGYAALMRFVFDDHEAAPVGTQVLVAGRNEPFLVGPRGQAYVHGLEKAGTVTLSWKGQRCQIGYALPATERTIVVKIAPAKCAGVER